MVVDDIFTFEQLGDVVPSPDGEWLAVVIVRARTSAETYRDFPFDRDHADIWLVPRRSGGGARRNLTHGVTDGSGYWNPVWSPDGKRLALLSTKGGDRVRPYVWEMASGTLRRLTDRGADMFVWGSGGFPGVPLIWRDGTTLLCPMLPDGAGQTYYWDQGVRSYSRASAAWAATAKGIEPSVSVLESGREIPARARAQGQLLEIDVVSGRSRVVAEGNIRQMLLDPTHRHLALIAETGHIPPRPDRKVLYDRRGWDVSRRTRLGLVALGPDAKAVWVDSVPDPSGLFAGGPHAWSPDGSSFAVIAKNAKDDEIPNTLWRLSVASATARRVVYPRLAISQVAWSAGGDLLAFGHVRAPVATNADTARSDWWLADPGPSREPRKLTARLAAVPPALLSTPDRHVMLGLAAGDLWSIDARDGTTGNATATFTPKLRSVVWPGTTVREVGPSEEPILEADDDSLYRVTWTGGAAQLRRLARPSPGAAVAASQPAQRLLAFTAEQGNGTFLWTGDGAREPYAERVALNEHARTLAEPKRMLIGYRGVEGDSLQALLVLPIGYESGRRYPLITWVYAGDVIRDTTYPLLSKQLTSSFNLNLLPSHGYALLIPSMPLPPPGSTADPYIDLPKGVMTAVDRAIDLGVADPGRLGVMGQSYGGYSTYALVTYTHRFKAAVARAGLSDLVSTYGTFVTPFRYDALVHEEAFAVSWAEDGQGRMGDSPWGNLWRYLRNSPLYFADRVKTPLMIVQGDIDYVPIQQGEEFFTALYRMGKEATFVRYWGEGHSPESPANVRDLWQRIFGWFDTHLQAGGGDAGRERR